MLTVKAESGELRAAILGMKKADKQMRKTVNDGMRETFNPIWKKAVAENLGGFSKAENMMTLGTRIKAGNPPELIAASSRRRYGRGVLRPAEHWYLVEFGSNGKKVSEYQRRSANGGTHTVRRHVMTGWPGRVKKGRIASPAARELIPRITSYFIQSVIRIWADQADKAFK